MIAEEAFVLAYPLVLMSRTMAQATAVVAPEPGTLRAPVNALVHGRDTPDTLRSSGWLDLAAEPVVLCVPATHGRYYVLWFRDAWSTVFASVGVRTTGTASHAFAVLGPGQHAVDLPSGLTSIEAPTRMVHVTGCIEAVGDTDDEARRRAHDGFRLVPLSRWRDDRAPANSSFVAAGDPVPPVEQLDRMDARADVLLALLDSDTDGRPLTGRSRYVLRFAPDAPPPVHGFWSLTTCPSAAGSLHSTGDLHGLALDHDGSLPIYIQHEPPAVDSAQVELAARHA